MRSWLVPVLLVGCGGDDGLSNNERALAGDGLRSVDPEALVVDTVERSFSGRIAYTPTDDPDVYAPLHAAAAASIETAQARLTPLGCLTAVKSPPGSNPVIEYTLTGCSVDGHTVDGAVTTTWMLSDAIHVVHELELEIDGVVTTGNLTLDVWQRESETRQRSYAMASAGVLLDGAWTATYDTAGCGTKRGLATVTVESGRTFTRVDDLTFCATETLDALEGALELSRDGLTLRVRLLGGNAAEVFTRGEARPVGVDELLD